MSSPTSSSPRSLLESCTTSFAVLDPKHADKPSQIPSTTTTSCEKAIQLIRSLDPQFQYLQKVAISRSATQVHYPVLGKDEFLCLLHLHKLPEQKAIEVCLSLKK